METKEQYNVGTKKNYTIKDVLNRYGLKTRQSFYSWTKALGLEVGKDIEGKSIITEEQIKLLDELSLHLKNGGTLKSFIPIISPQIINDTIAVNSTIDIANNGMVKLNNANENMNMMLNSNHQQLELFETVNLVVSKIVELIPRSPINHWDELNKAVNNGYILTTLEVKSLLGVKPSGNEWIRGAFKFTKVGKIGTQSGWKVNKI